MATDVVMPQMGESVAEGTVVRWIKKVGDKVERDEPLFEISTDKVDAEIPSPVAGVLAEIRVKEGETVPVSSVVAVIGEAGSAPAPGASEGAARPETTSTSPPPAPRAAVPEPVSREAAAPEPGTPAPLPRAPSASTAEALHQRSSPLVRRIAKEHDVDISQLRGTGIGGRVTKNDVLAFVESGQSGKASPGPSSDRVEKMSVMRRQIAEHMVGSRRTSAHVHSVFEVSFSRVAGIRDAKRAEYERQGVKLTYLPFIIKAVVDGLRATPVINASVDGDSVVYHRDVNIGIAVALDWGLIVPVIKHADDKNLLGLSRALADLAERARTKHLKPDEVSGGTFTITNPGTSGALFGMPIINQPQVAILGVGAVEKRPVVIEDTIGIRPMAYLTLGFDHRIIDGAVADEFLSHVKKAIENWDPAAA